jgi:transposase
MSNPWLVGVDVHRQTNTVALLALTGREAAPRFTMDNNRPGTRALAQRLNALVTAQGYDAIHIAAEATGWYWWHFFQQLAQDPLLNAQPVLLYPFNPRLTANFKKTYSDLDKTDLIDAFVIADRLRLGRDLPQPFSYDGPALALRFLTRQRFHLVHQLVREKAYFIAHLYLKASEYTHLKPFADIFGATSRALLQDYATIEQIAALPLDDLVELSDVQGKRRFADPDDNARKLQSVAPDSYLLPEALQAPVNLILRQSGQLIATLKQQVQRIESAIAEASEQRPHTLDTVPGLGHVLAAGISAEIGDLARFDYDEARVAKFAGFTWHQTQSADFQAEETRLTRTGNRYLRYYLCEGANSVRMRDAEYGAYCDRKYHEVRMHQHKRAIVLTARKRVRLVVRLLTTNQPYRPRKA